MPRPQLIFTPTMSVTEASDDDSNDDDGDDVLVVRIQRRTNAGLSSMMGGWTARATRF